MTVAETLTLLLAFGMFIISLLSLIVKLIEKIKR